MLTITHDQMHRLALAAHPGAVRDLADRLRETESSGFPHAVPVATMAEADLADLAVRLIALSERHGIGAWDDIVALARGVVRYGEERFLSPAVLRHPQLAPAEKVSVMTELALKAGAPSPHVQVPPPDPAR